MLEAPFAILAEILVPLVSGVVEVALLVLVASVRPWAYVLWPAYRAKENKHLATLSSWRKAWYMAWGSLALIGSIAIVYGCTLLWQAARTAETSQPKSLAGEAVRKAMGTLSHAASSPVGR